MNAPDIPEGLAAVAADLVARGADPAHVDQLLDAYRQAPDEWGAEFERALAAGDKHDRLAETVSGLIAAGADHDLVRRRLEVFHLELLGQDREADDDIVLEVLDILVGF